MYKASKYTLFIKCSCENFIAFSVYVNNIVVTNNNVEEKKKLKSI